MVLDARLVSDLGRPVSFKGSILNPLAVPYLLTVTIGYICRRRFPAGCCQRCGCLLTGNRSGVCPECGTAGVKSIAARDSQHEPSQPQPD
jgi:hypothetical protein